MKKSIFICIVAVVVMLNFLLQKNNTLGYFIEDATSSLVAKVTWFGLICAPLLCIVGTIDKWHNGSYLNQLVRTVKLYSLVINIYFINILRVFGIVFVSLLINTLMTGVNGTEEGVFNLFVSYMFYTSIYMVFELLFSSTVAVLSMCALLLFIALGKIKLSILGTLVFQPDTCIHQTMLTVCMTMTLVTVFWQLLKQKEFYGKGI
ncbi:hypothetical protein N2F28_02640 [Leuconostoc falkenbergense]|jgi:hypothetical protein|uniref:Uncharacterized protein n=1 Tax=Leuconostoc falkenbergense TaxID=2766470 RepID=A0A9X3E7W8_9LACO|nr:MULTISPECIES: hypothetical protein [Leuconostoc]RDG17818.1 hypothetical protein DQM11_08420 [Leuconostoc pseudomesenteroides]MCT4390183.1 hypothetical protein [Leuconostoc falkenbergense]MCT4411442.1 hypothetical protein [Leuconostoc falkenbergense]MCX7578986.1 hypothetical protein [Leuconostoc falkenbergense]MDM7647204.1 hypothetical protein [Leuconostoc falkenbergense]